MIESLKVTLLGFTVPDDVLRASGVDVTIAPQTRNFAHALHRSLQEGGAEVSLISTLPLLNFPGTRKVFCASREFTMDGSLGQTLGFVNLVGLKHLTRFLACLSRGRRAIAKSDPHVVLIHGVHSPLLWFGLLVKARKRIPVVTVLTDPPGRILPTDNAAVRALKRLDAWLIRRTLARMTAVVSLTEDLAVSLAPQIPHLVMEGILNPQIQGRRPPPVDDTEPFRITYAGGLSEEYGVRALVEAVQHLKHAQIHLQVCGSGHLEPWLAEVASKDSRIEFLGTLDLESVLALLYSSDLLVNPRPIDQEFVRFSFPSKLIEYMSTGRPVLTTRLPGIPKEYLDHLWILESATVPAIAAGIETVMSTAAASRIRRGESARSFVVERTNSASQGRRIVEFLRDSDR